MTQSILFVGGANLDRSVVERLEQNGFAISATQDFESAIEVLAASPIDLVIVQIDETEEGMRLIKQLREVPGTKASAVLAIAEWGTGLPTAALAAGADAYEPAPIDPERLVEAVQRVLHKRAAAVGMND